MNTPEKESVLSRWSRRKHESSHSEKNEITSEESGIADDAAVENAESTEGFDIHSLTDEDMPDIESLDEESDYSGFLSKNVSEGLRKLALQKLFHSKTYHICDGLDDYDGNYTVFEKLDTSIITVDMKHRLELEAQRSLEEMAAEETDKEHASELQTDIAEDEISADVRLTENTACSVTTHDETDHGDDHPGASINEEIA